MIEHVVINLDQFGRVFRDMAAFGDHRAHPFAGIAGTAARQRHAFDIRQVEPRQQRVDMVEQFLAGQHVADAGQRQRGAGIDGFDLGAGIRAGHHRDMQCAGQAHIGGIVAPSGDKAAIFLHPALLADIFEIAVGHHDPRIFWAAIWTASTIC